MQNIDALLSHDQTAASIRNPHHRTDNSTYGSPSLMIGATGSSRALQSHAIMLAVDIRAFSL